MKQLRTWWPFTFLTWGWIINTILWLPQLGYGHYEVNNWSMVALQILHSATIILFLMCLLIIGDVLSWHHHSLATVIKMWLYTVGLALTILLINWLGFNHFNYHYLYQALLPISRNLAPVATAIIIATLILPWLQHQLRPRLRASLLILLTPLAITTIFNNDAFGLLHGNSVSFYLLIMTIGSLIGRHPFDKRQVSKWLLIALGINLLLVVLMPNASFQVHGTMVTANRFTTPTSLSMVGVAIGCYLLFRHSLTCFADHLRFPHYFLLSLAILFGDPVIINELGRLAKLTTAWPLQLLILIVYDLVSLVIAAYAPLIARKIQQPWRLSQRIQHRCATDPALTPDQRLSQLGHQLAAWFMTQWPAGLALLLAYGCADLSIYYMGNQTHFVKQSMLWFTAILIFLTFKALQALTNRYWLALLLTGLFNAIWIVANIQKMNLRNEPILPSELPMVGDLDSLLKMIDYHLLIYAGIGIIIVVIAIIFLERWRRVQRLTWPWRIFWFALTVCVFGSAAFWNHHDSRMQTLITGLDDQPHFIHQAVGAKQNGPTVQFLNNVDITIMNRPDGYSRAAMKRISHKYSQVAQRINVHRTNQLRDQTVIFNLSESFANPDRVPGVSLRANPIPRIERIKRQTTSGIMISSGYGGGTADMEYMTLTGFAMCNFAQTLSTPYTQLVPYLKHNPTIVQSFNYAAAIHPYSKKFYDRGTDYPKFGFNKFSYLGSKKYPIRHQMKIDDNTYLSDQTAYANTFDQLQSHHGPQFINLVTMQNHLPYNNLYSDRKTDHFKATVGDGTNPEQVANYAVGIHYTDKAVTQFIKKIDHIDRPITLVFYGDHLPGIYRNSMKKDGLKLHETDYFIYSNPAARRQGAKRLTRSTHYVGPNDFIAMAAEQTNSKVTPYQAMLTQLYHQLPAYALSTQQNGTNSFNSAPEYVNQNGKVVAYHSFNHQQRELWHDYQLVQYDITAGHHYLLHTNMMK